MMVAFQASLLDADQGFGLAELGPGLRRVELEHGAWLEVRPGWITGADALFDRLARSVPWRAERRRMYDSVVDVPRLLCHYDEGQPLPDPALELARDALSARYLPELGEPLPTAGL